VSPATPSPVASAAPARVVSIRWIVTGAVAALVTLIVLSAGALSERNARAVLADQLEARLLVQSQNLALSSSGALTTEFPELTLQPIVNAMLTRQPDLAFVAVVDRRGRVAGHSDLRRLGSAWTSPDHLVADAHPPRVIPGQRLLRNPTVLVAETPVIAAGVEVGRAFVALRRDAIDVALARSRRQQLLALAGFLIVGVISALVLVTMLLRPIGALRAGIERIGRGDLETPLEVHDRTEIGALAGTVNRMAAALREAQAQTIERERLAHEMELAEEIQRSLLPPTRIVDSRYVIDGGQRPAAQVGGDFYDVLDLPEGRIGIVIADVAGKGVAGSLVTAMLKALVRALAPAHASPAAMMTALDEQLGALLERKSFVTLFYGVLDPATDVMRFASAGHNPMLVLRAAAREPEWLRARGPALGALRGAARPRHREELEIAIRPGDMLVQFTDGVSEALAPDGSSEFGLDRLARAALAGRRGGAAEVLRTLAEAVRAWQDGGPPSDDETVLVIERRADATRGGPIATSDWNDAAALADLDVARALGRRLTLPASLPALVRLDDWLGALEPFVCLDARAASVVRLALHEACANVVEHACHRDASQSFDLWWVPVPAGEAADPASAIARGWFLLRDRGDAFDESAWRPARLEDPEVRRRGRGFGLDILHRVSARLDYRPRTPQGNLMRLAIDPHVLAAREEAS